MSSGDSGTLYEMNLTTGMAYIYGPAGKNAHVQALKEDRDKSYRLVVNIVGKVRQGKTSLRRMLVGEAFNEHEESTVGIEHDFVETVGSRPTDTSSWPKVDLQKANVEECDLIVGKHVQQRLERVRKGKQKRIDTVLSFMKATVLAYLMTFLYFTMAESETLKGLPWFPIMLIISFAFSGLFLFGSIRDGFGMAVGVLCLVLYIDSSFRWKIWDSFHNIQTRTCFPLACLLAFLFYGLIHLVSALSMGVSLALGFCFVLCACDAPWSSDILDYNLFCDAQVHLFVILTLIGIWTIRFPMLAIGTLVCIVIIIQVIPEKHAYIIVSGLGCGYSHAIFIKLGFDLYVKFVNPLLKSITTDRFQRRCLCHVIGIFPGLFLAYVFDWKLTDSWKINSSFGLLFVVFIEACHKLLEGKVVSAPKASIKNPTQVLNSRLKEASLKLVIRDFAGHPLYHSVHHIYMMGHCVYLVVFNLVEAKLNFKYCISEILYWLQAIYVHDRYPEVRAFIVGTHRDNPKLSRDDIEDISGKLFRFIPRQFHNMLVWNTQPERPLFFVENSIRNGSDPDHRNLRNHIISIANDHMKPKYPIRYFYFFRVISQCREAGRLIETLDRMQTMCEQNECDVSGDGQLEDLLLFFHESGEIIYNSYDNNQNQLVVLDPRALVEIMIALVRPPPRSERANEFIRAWQVVEDTGICSEKLLKHILGKSTLINKEVSLETLIELLEYLDLLCKLNLGSEDGLDIIGEKCYLLPALLKDILPYPQNYWEDIPEDVILYVDFGPVIPKFILMRLVCQCVARSRIGIGSDGSFHLNASTSKALLTYHQSHTYKLELLDVNEVPNPSQQLLKIVIRGADKEGAMRLATNICQMIENIVERDFRKCRYKVGILCPYEEPHDFCQYEAFHIFPLYERIKARHGIPSNRQVQLMRDEEFWCRGRAVIFQQGQVRLSRDERRPRATVGLVSRTQRQRSSVWSSNILDLPSRLFSDICDDLNIPKPLGSDWTTLAGELDKTARDVSLLQLRSPRDPCDALLQDWAATDENATVSELVKILRAIERPDVVKRIEDFVNSHQ